MLPVIGVLAGASFLELGKRIVHRPNKDEVDTRRLREQEKQLRQFLEARVPCRAPTFPCRAALAAAAPPAAPASPPGGACI